ncbi:MAG: hypothetical protein V4638_05265 [Bacteroidota bacterium]
MKNLIVICLLCGFAFLMNSCAVSKSVEAKVVRDCTGVYVRIDEKDYLVCNKSKLVNFENGDLVLVKSNETDNIDECEGKNDIVCMMYHEHAAVVTVSSIKKVKVRD